MSFDPFYLGYIHREEDPGFVHDPGYPQAAFLFGGSPRIKKRQDRGTPTD